MEVIVKEFPEGVTGKRFLVMPSGREQEPWLNAYTGTGDTEQEAVENFRRNVTYSREQIRLYQNATLKTVELDIPDE